MLGTWANKTVTVPGHEQTSVQQKAAASVKHTCISAGLLETVTPARAAAPNPPISPCRPGGARGRDSHRVSPSPHATAALPQRGSTPPPASHSQQFIIMKIIMTVTAQEHADPVFHGGCVLSEVRRDQTVCSTELIIGAATAKLGRKKGASSRT